MQEGVAAFSVESSPGHALRAAGSPGWAFCGELGRSRGLSPKNCQGGSPGLFSSGGDPKPAAPPRCQPGALRQPGGRDRGANAKHRPPTLDGLTRSATRPRSPFRGASGQSRRKGCGASRSCLAAFGVSPSTVRAGGLGPRERRPFTDPWSRGGKEDGARKGAKTQSRTQVTREAAGVTAAGPPLGDVEHDRIGRPP